MIAKTYQGETIHLTFSNPNILNKLSTRFTSIRNKNRGSRENSRIGALVKRLSSQSLTFCALPLH
ncbi:hypothetical protein OIU74_028206, partial [Salix koriyanagi]